MAKKDIIQELNNLDSSLADLAGKNVYSVPGGYFEGFAEQLQSIIWLETLPKTTPFAVPTGYFEGLEEKIMEVIRNHPDYQTSKEELESISPLLNSLNKRPVYSVPDGYFENLRMHVETKELKTKVFSIASRKWLKYAAAAVVTGVILLAGLMVYNNNNKPTDTPGRAPLAKFEKEVKKIEDIKSTENLIDFIDAGLNEKELASNHRAMKTDDVQLLLRDIPIDELQEFSEQSKDIEDVMMAN